MREIKKSKVHLHNRGSFCYRWNVFKDITRFTMIISENTASFNLAVIFSRILSHMLSKLNIFMKSIYSYIQETFMKNIYSYIQETTRFERIMEGEHIKKAILI